LTKSNSELQDLKNTLDYKAHVKEILQNQINILNAHSSKLSSHEEESSNGGVNN
jgi:hypothetical protein